MSWLQFIVALPICAVGFIFEWARDMFERGRAYYNWLSPRWKAVQVGPKVQGNRECIAEHQFVTHGGVVLDEVPRTYDGLRVYLDQNQIEGVVWHHPNGRTAKIKRKDFGFRW